MRSGIRIAAVTFATLLLLALGSAAARAQACPPNPSGGNRLVSTDPGIARGSGGSWYTALLPFKRTIATFRLPLPAAPASTPTKLPARRVAR